MTRRLLIVGCARSGTGYAAKLLGKVGLEVGHEAVFGPPDGLTPGPGASTGHDVSWLAVPRLEELDDGWIVLHQVRHPVAVASSTLAINMFDERHWQTQRLRFWLNSRLHRPTARSGPSYVELAYRSAPAIVRERTPVDRAFRYWVEWNRMAGASCRRRHRVEDINESWLETVLAAVGSESTKQAIAAAIASSSTSTNHRGSGPRLTIQDISSDRLQDEVFDLATEYGYEL